MVNKINFQPPHHHTSQCPKSTVPFHLPTATVLQFCTSQPSHHWTFTWPKHITAPSYLPNTISLHLYMTKPSHQFPSVIPFYLCMDKSTNHFNSTSPNHQTNTILCIQTTTPTTIASVQYKHHCALIPHCLHNLHFHTSQPTHPCTSTYHNHHTVTSPFPTTISLHFYTCTQSIRPQWHSKTRWLSG